jgi:stage II sporulation protein AB (anti-sigma F factor)
MDNRLYIKVPAISENEAFLRNVVAAFCVPLNPTVEQIDDIKTAVSEAVTNCVVHAYDSEKGDIEVEASLSDGVIHIRVTDFGKGIVDLKKAVSPYYSTASEKERAGIGFTVMKTFMDGLEVFNNPDGGLSVNMWKNMLKEV